MLETTTNCMRLEAIHYIFIVMCHFMLECWKFSRKHERFDIRHRKLAKSATIFYSEGSLRFKYFKVKLYNYLIDV